MSFIASLRTIHVVTDSALPPARVLEAAHDFSQRRADVWPNISTKHLTVHGLGDTFGDVTEGTGAGPIVVWERCDYNWSQPGSVENLERLESQSGRRPSLSRRPARRSRVVQPPRCGA